MCAAACHLLLDACCPCCCCPLLHASAAIAATTIDATAAARATAGALDTASAKDVAKPTLELVAKCCKSGTLLPIHVKRLVSTVPADAAAVATAAMAALWPAVASGVRICSANPSEFGIPDMSHWQDKQIGG